MNKCIKIILKVISPVIVLAVLTVLGARIYFRFPVREYYKNSEKAFKIPSVNGGYVQQGLAYFDGVFYITAYRTDGGASAIFAVDANTGKEIKSIKLADVNGEKFCGHVGGIAVNENYVYIADKTGLVTYLKEDADRCESGGEIRAQGTFSTQGEDDGLGVAFVHIENGSIFAGEFYREENYPTRDSHKYTTNAGDENGALILEFKLDANAQYGILDKIERAYSVKGLVQGMCFDPKGRICLSTSYATAFSHISIYGEAKKEGEITVLGQNTERYVLDSSCLEEEIKIPPMSEEIAVADGKLYVMCESASNKYIFGKLTSAQYCYATDLSNYG